MHIFFLRLARRREPTREQGDQSPACARFSYVEHFSFQINLGFVRQNKCSPLKPTSFGVEPFLCDVIARLIFVKWVGHVIQRHAN
jgi:hypothetical protein